MKNKTCLVNEEHLVLEKVKFHSYNVMTYVIYTATYFTNVQYNIFRCIIC